jgi:NADP-dependent 3-hydroxy acid dehydrogenase YdfG
MSEPDTDLEDHRVAITGASSGIGAAAARRLAREGADVALAARREEKLESLADDLEAAGADVLVRAVDVRDWDDVRAFADAVDETWGRVDVLFANAGVGGSEDVGGLDVEEWNRVQETNLDGVFHAAKAFEPLLVEAPDPSTAAITASVSGTMGMPGSSAYCASKWGVRGFAQSWAQEVADRGVRVTTLNPGFVNTRWHSGHPRADEMIQPEDLADLLVTLATMPETAMLDDVTVWPTKMYSE